MLLKDVTKVSELDKQINELHQALANLYSARAEYLEGSTVPTPTSHGSTERLSATWEKAEYANLAQAWKLYQINIPHFTELAKALRRAKVTIDGMVQNCPQLNDQLHVVLVPPAKMLNLTALSNLRDKQDFVHFTDYIEAVLAPRFLQKKWRLLVMQTTPEAMNLGSAETILDQKRYIINGHDARGLGIQEYIAFTLQQNVACDVDTWSLLLKNYQPKANTVPSAGFVNGHYRIDLDDIKGLLGEERFRPAVEITL